MLAGPYGLKRLTPFASRLGHGRAQQSSKLTEGPERNRSSRLSILQNPPEPAGILSIDSEYVDPHVGQARLARTTARYESANNISPTFPWEPGSGDENLDPARGCGGRLRIRPESDTVAA